MYKKHKVNIWVVLLILTAISSTTSCKKDEPNPNNDAKELTDSFRVASATQYRGSDLESLIIEEKLQYQYNSQNQLTSITITNYEDGEVLNTFYTEYHYEMNKVISKEYFDLDGSKLLLNTRFFMLNDQNLVIKDSSVSEGDINYLNLVYNTNHKITHSYVDQIEDTAIQGTYYLWNGNNLEQEYLKNGLMPQKLIMTYTYGSKLNKNKFGDFWNQGYKSENLPEKSEEPFYQHNYTYKIEKDGFVTEIIKSESSIGGEPNYFEKTVYTR